MKIALWIIAICEVVRALQNAINLKRSDDEKDKRIWAYEEFVKSLKQSDKEFVEKMLREFERDDEDGNDKRRKS